MIVNVADRAPAAPGVKEMRIVQEAFRASLDLQVEADWAKSLAFAPLMSVDDMVTVAPLLFVTVTFLEALVLAIPWFPKDSDVGETVRGPALGLSVNVAGVETPS